MMLYWVSSPLRKLFVPEESRYSLVSAAVVLSVFFLAYYATECNKGNVELRFTVKLIAGLTSILVFCLMFRVSEILRKEERADRKAEHQRNLKRRKEELSLGGMLLSFFGVAFPLFVQASAAPYTVAGLELVAAAWDLIVLVLMFSWYAEIVWDCNEEEKENDGFS